MMWIPLTYLGIGIIWAVFVTVMMMNGFRNTGEAVLCFVCNVLFWPLIMILAFAAGKLFNRMKEDSSSEGWGD